MAARSVTRSTPRPAAKRSCVRCCLQAFGCCCSVTAILAPASPPRCATLLAAHAGVILVNADSPTLPASILRAALDATPRGGVVLSPSRDGGYTLIGLSQLHERLFTDIPWSTAGVHRITVARAEEIGCSVTEVPGWYDVDDAESLALLRRELAGEPLPFAPAGSGATAPATRSFFARRR